MGDRIVVLDKGVIQQVDNPENIYYNPDNMFVGGFLGSPPMNFIPVTLENGKVRFNETDIALSSEQIAALNGEKDFIIGIRPEKTDILDYNCEFVADVEISEMLGSEKIVYFAINGAKCSAKLDAQKKFDKTVDLHFNTNDFLFFNKETGARIK